MNRLQILERQLAWEKIINFIEHELSVSEVVNVEENCGNIWITLEDGSVKSISIIDCEKEEGNE